MAGDRGRVVVAVVLGVGVVIAGIVTGSVGLIAVGLVAALLGWAVLKILG